jgi:hypothetical protein
VRAAALGLAALALLGAASPTASEHRYVEYNEGTPLVIECPARLVCFVDLKPGERVAPELVGSQVQLWDPHVLYSGATPHLTLRPDAPGRRADFVLASDGPHPHLYSIVAVSTPVDWPMMRVTLRYTAEERHDARVRALAEARRPKPTPAPTIAQEMDAACAANHDVYGIDPLPPDGRHRGDDDTVRAIHPSRVCHSTAQTFIQLPPTSTSRADLPVVIEAASDGERAVTAPFRDGIFRVSDVAHEYVLVQGKTRVRVQWQPEKTAAR